MNTLSSKISKGTFKNGRLLPPLMPGILKSVSRGVPRPRNASEHLGTPRETSDSGTVLNSVLRGLPKSPGHRFLLNALAWQTSGRVGLFSLLLLRSRKDLRQSSPAEPLQLKRENSAAQSRRRFFGPLCLLLLKYARNINFWHRPATPQVPPLDPAVCAQKWVSLKHSRGFPMHNVNGVTLGL